MGSAPLATLPANSGDERDLLLSWLAYLRGAVLRKAAGLSDDQARWRPAGALIPLLGLVHHLTIAERRWVDAGLLGQPNFGQADDEFDPPGLTLTEAVTAYAERAAATEAAVRGLPSLQAPCSLEPGTDARWVLLHLINETARHAGHADAVRELLDGVTGE